MLKVNQKGEGRTRVTQQLCEISFFSDVEDDKERVGHEPVRMQV